ncbi:MAG: EAL domain-containing protein [Parerythrobacter sp.]
MALPRFLGRRSRDAEPVPAPHDARTRAAVAPPGFAAMRRADILDEYERAGVGWIWATDAQGVLCYLSEAAAASLEMDRSLLIGQSAESVFEISRESSDSHAVRPIQFQLSGRKKIRDQIVRLTPAAPEDAEGQVWWAITGFPVYDSNGAFDGYRGSAADVTREHEKQLAESRLAEFDALTGLANRRSVDRLLDSTLAAHANDGRSCALMMLDLDKFKRVNDTLGHQAGDDLLREVADRLTNIVGKRGMVARLGGDEFQIVLRDMDDRGALGELANKIIQILSQPYPLQDGKRAIVGTSIGIAIAPFEGDTREDLSNSADLALYAAKNGGRGQFRFYSKDLKNEEEVRQAMLDDLREALQEGQLALHYQPIVNTADGAIVGMEALMRWEHPERGFVPPDQFIPVAEDCDLINQLGEWALRTACDTAKDWPEQVRVGVNVSAVQFANPGFPGIVAKVLAHSGIAPDRLELELTESIFVGDSEETEASFAALKALGVRLALDDFGTGYSSLSYLRAAPFDKIKVDKSFVDSCTRTDRSSAKIIAAIVGLSNALGMETVVEGVEAFDQLEIVRERGATFVQGFIYARPMPARDIAAGFADGSFTITPAGPDIYRPDRRSVLRRVGVIHEDYYYNAVMRDLSRNGAGLVGIIGPEPGTQLVLDLGDGQLAVGTVTRTIGAELGVEFETHLVEDGAGGLCTRHRVSRYTVAQSGLPEKPGTAGPKEGKRHLSQPRFQETDAGLNG